jgi:predicted metal-binding protein
MARITTNRAEMTRRREIMDAAMVRARSARLAYEAAAAVRMVRMKAPESKDHGHPAPRLTVAEPTAMTVSRATSCVNSKPMPVPETKVVTWLREHGDANKMTLLSSDERTSGQRVYVVRCGTCSKDLRAMNVTALLNHIASPAHVSACESGRAPETNIAAWIREHGDVHKMALLSIGEVASKRHRMHVVRCGTCQMELRVQDLSVLRKHIDSAAHVSAIQSGRAPETKVDTWIHEHGDAHKMTLLSIVQAVRSIWVVRCGACNMVLRLYSAHELLLHAGCRRHIAALASKSEGPPLRKRPRC